MKLIDYHIKISLMNIFKRNLYYKTQRVVDNIPRGDLLDNIWRPVQNVTYIST